MNTTATDTQNQKTQAPAPAQPQNQPQGYVSPEVNIFETKEGYVLQAEMPGVNKTGLDISLEGNTLTIHGRRNAPALAAETLYRESTAFDYRRVFELDPAIDVTKIDARMEQGILTLQLPKSERVKPRKITVGD
jgi:HSP20 family protein